MKEILTHPLVLILFVFLVVPFIWAIVLIPLAFGVALLATNPALGILILAILSLGYQLFKE